MREPRATRTREPAGGQHRRRWLEVRGERGAPRLTAGASGQRAGRGACGPGSGARLRACSEGRGRGRAGRGAPLQKRRAQGREGHERAQPTRSAAQARRLLWLPLLRGLEREHRGCCCLSLRSAEEPSASWRERARRNLETPLGPRGAAGTEPPLACCAVRAPRSPEIYVLRVALSSFWCVTGCAVRTRHLRWPGSIKSWESHVW